VVENPFNSGTVFAEGDIFFTDPDPGQNFSLSFGPPTMTSHVLFLAPNQPPQPLPGPVVVGQWSWFVEQQPNGTTPGKIHWSYNVSESDIRSMTSGEDMSAFFPVTLSDGHGGSVTQKIKIDVIGTDETPFLLPALPSDIPQYLQHLPTSDHLTHLETHTFEIDETPAVTNGSGHHRVTGSIAFIDPDTFSHNGQFTYGPPEVTFSVTDNRHTGPGEEAFNAHATTLMNGFSYTVDQHGNYGTINWAYDVDDRELDFLAAGSTFGIQANFSIGGLAGGASSAININLKGADDAPVIAGPATTFVTVDLTHSAKSASGSFTVTDPDWFPDGLSTAFEWHDPANHGFVFGGTGVSTGQGGSGAVSWNYTADFGPGTLAPGQHDVFDVVVTDASGVTARHTVDVLLI
jgi:VCBS repeat-containing protein